ARNLKGKVEVFGVVASSRFRRYEGHRPQRSTAGIERNDHTRAPGSQPPENPKVLRVLRAGDQDLLRNLRIELGLPGADDPRNPIRIVHVRGPHLLEFSCHLDLGGITVRDRKRLPELALLWDVDRAPVGQEWHRDLGELVKG